MTGRILIVEDDAALARLLFDNLAFEGFVTERANDGPEALEKATSFAPDLVLLDLALPRLDGFDVCRTLIARFPSLRIIILTVRAEKDDKIRGLELGADDYVTKPFALDELLARVHAVLRRVDPRVWHIALGDLKVDLRLHRAERNGRDLRLTHREYEVLQYLAERRGHVVTREELLRGVWGYREVPLTRTVDNFIARLRRKVELDPHNPRFILTAHGGGYSLATTRVK
jgi:DNA-binding response OmpR family regulator